MAYGHKDFGYQFNAWRANLSLCSLTNFLEVSFDFLKVRFLFLPWRGDGIEKVGIQCFMW